MLGGVLVALLLLAPRPARAQPNKVLGDGTAASCTEDALRDALAGGGTDLVNTKPLLGPLAFGSAPTPFHPLLPGSPGLDAVPIGQPLTDCGGDVQNDQRGVGRPIDGDGNGSLLCDIGAVEYQPGEKPLRIWMPLLRR